MMEDEGKGKRGTTRMTSPEKWEIKQVLTTCTALEITEERERERNLFTFYSSTVDSSWCIGEVRLSRI